MPPPYVIDTSGIIDGRRRYYPPSVFPGVWDNIEDLIDAGDLFSPEECLVDLARQDDEVHGWAKNQAGLFLPLDDEIQLATQDILTVYPDWNVCDGLGIRHLTFLEMLQDLRWTFPRA